MSKSTPPAWLAVTWALVGLSLLLGRALFALTPIAYSTAIGGLTAVQWGIAAVWVGFMAFAEGYRGFQLRFAPMVAARVLELYRHPTWVRTLLAPGFVIGLFQATRRRLIISWSILIGVTLIVIAVRWLPAPWRGIVDMGVVVGLGWGSIALAIQCSRALIRGDAPGNSELP
ncbi:MAG: hypothetical protein AB8H79_21335 [Myxococcota bacterium]